MPTSSLETGYAVIMPSTKHSKLKERLALSDRIQKNGILMPSCSNCVRAGRDCIVASDSRKCGECVRRGSRCDVHGPSVSNWEKLKKEEERLEAEEELAAQQEHEAFARRMRLRRMQKALKERSAEMLRRGLATLDELDEAEEKDRQEKAKQAESSTVSFATVEDLPDIFDSLSPSFWQGLDVVDGTPATAPGS